MRTFISYSTAHDQIIALRLQTLAAVYGMTVYVPPATTRQTWPGVLVPEVQDQLREADVVLAVITQGPTPSAVAEINTASQLGKLVIPIVSYGVPQQHYIHFPAYFIVNPSDPSQTEGEIVKFLAQKQQAQSTRVGLLALATLAVGLLLFGSEPS
jgi:hypothetical protein